MSKFDRFLSENCVKSPYAWSDGGMIDSIEIWFDVLIDRWETSGVPPFITDFANVEDIEKFNIYLLRKKGRKSILYANNDPSTP